ncbi:hypothetical protein DFH06DRAFT_1346382 [Mycena polygramma]|nr:hypothetical protein DFH06DRAFT_1346382 [Mycena polygramma]
MRVRAGLALHVEFYAGVSTAAHTTICVPRRGGVDPPSIAAAVLADSRSPCLRCTPTFSFSFLFLSLFPLCELTNPAYSASQLILTPTLMQCATTHRCPQVRTTRPVCETSPVRTPAPPIRVC